MKRGINADALVWLVWHVWVLVLGLALAVVWTPWALVTIAAVMVGTIARAAT